MPSRVIIRTVKPKTPRNAARPTLTDDASSRPSISRFIRFPARHMCTVSDATSTAAVNREDAFPERLVVGLGEQEAGPDAQQDRHADAPVDRGEQCRAGRSSSGMPG